MDPLWRSIQTISSEEDLRQPNLPLGIFMRLAEEFNVSELKRITAGLQSVSLDRIVVEIDSPGLGQRIESIGPILSCAELSHSQALAAAEATQSEAYANRMNFLSMEKQTESRAVLERAVHLGQSTGYYRGSSLVGFMISRHFNHDGLDKALISWIWADPALDLRLKTEFKALICETLRSSSYKRFIASVHIENLRSLRFFEKLGFKPTWLSLKADSR